MRFSAVSAVSRQRSNMASRGSGPLRDPINHVLVAELILASVRIDLHPLVAIQSGEHIPEGSSDLIVELVEIACPGLALEHLHILA
jgi:hypothetical protein